MSARPMLALGGLFILWGCGGGNRPPHQLEGSLSELMDLRYESADVAQGVGEIAVRFLRKKGEGEDVVFKVAADLTDLVLEPRVAVDLAARLASWAQRGTMTRNVLEDPRHDFPKLWRGSMVFDRLPVSGERISGELSLTFEQGIEAASGRTAFGFFEAKVQ